MYKFILLNELNDNKHKYEVVLYNTDTKRLKSIKFGAYGMKDFIIYNKEQGETIANERKRLYIIRHSKNENYNDVTSKGFWSMRLLWNKKTLKESLIDTIKKFKMY